MDAVALLVDIVAHKMLHLNVSHWSAALALHLLISSECAYVMGVCCLSKSNGILQKSQKDSLH